MHKRIIYNRFNQDHFHTHMKVLKLVLPNSTVLEIGSSTGYFTRELLKKGCQVVCVEANKDAVREAGKHLQNKIIEGKVEDIKKYLTKKEKFDYIILADVLEHLADPSKCLTNLLGYLKPEGRLVISLPNIANFSIRFNLLFWGKFNYQEYGILDKTHLHFFTNKTARDLFRKKGLIVDCFDVTAGFAVSPLYAKTLGRITFRIKPLRYIEDYLTRLFPGFFALEFIYVLKKSDD